jgi:hypothetical protein
MDGKAELSCFPKILSVVIAGFIPATHRSTELLLESIEK